MRANVGVARPSLGFGKYWRENFFLLIEIPQKNFFAIFPPEKVLARTRQLRQC